MSGHWLVYSILAFIIAACSVMVVCHKNPVVSAIFLVLNLFFLAGVYAMQGSDFLAAIQVIVYAGAIVVLFLFVIMLLNLDPDHITKVRKHGLDYVYLLLIMGTFLLTGLRLTQTVPVETATEVSSITDHSYAIGMKLFTSYLWPFELASILILLALIASIVIAKKKPQSSPNP